MRIVGTKPGEHPRRARAGFHVLAHGAHGPRVAANAERMAALGADRAQIGRLPHIALPVDNAPIIATASKKVFLEDGVGLVVEYDGKSGTCARLPALDDGCKLCFSAEHHNACTKHIARIAGEPHAWPIHPIGGRHAGTAGD